MKCYINDIEFTEEPSSCGSCPFFANGRTALYTGDEKGLCSLFDESHKRWINPPARCKRLFKKASKFNHGEHLAIVNQ